MKQNDIEFYKALIQEGKHEECLSVFREHWKDMEPLMNENEENIEELADFMSALVEERDLGFVPEGKDSLHVLTRLANGAYPLKQYKTRSRENRVPDEKGKKKVEEIASSEDNGSSSKSEASSESKPEDPVVISKGTVHTFAKALKGLEKRMSKLEETRMGTSEQKKKGLRQRLLKAGARLKDEGSPSSSSSEASTEYESQTESDSSVDKRKSVRRTGGKNAEKRRRSRLMARLAKQDFPPMELMVSERITEETLLNIFSAASTVSTYVDSARYSNIRNRKEARVLARAVDFLIADLGIKQTARLRATEVLIRRLAAIHEAEATGEWAVANELEESSWRREMISEKVRRRMLRSARLNKEVSSLKSRGPKAGRDHDGGDGKE